MCVCVSVHVCVHMCSSIFQTRCDGLNKSEVSYSYCKINLSGITKSCWFLAVIRGMRMDQYKECVPCNPVMQCCSMAVMLTHQYII